jgi:hypothetical protein
VSWTTTTYIATARSGTAVGTFLRTGAGELEGFGIQQLVVCDPAAEGAVLDGDGEFVADGLYDELAAGAAGHRLVGIGVEVMWLELAAAGETEQQAFCEGGLEHRDQPTLWPGL